MSVTRTRVTAAALLAVALSAGYLAQGTFAAGIPANKVAASGSTIETVGSSQNQSLEEVVLSATVKINNPTDLIINASSECAILTQVTNSANGQTETAFGRVKFYVTIDGIRVPIAKDDTDKGEVVFCEHTQEQQWTEPQPPDGPGEDKNDKLRQYLSTRSANSFQWLALNVGTTYPGVDGDSNVHQINLVAHYDTTATANAVADAYIGNRTLVLEPVKAAHGETVEIA